MDFLEPLDEPMEQEEPRAAQRPHEGVCRHYDNPLHYHIPRILTHAHPREYKMQYGPLPRSGHRMVCIDSCVYLVGGYCPVPARGGVVSPDMELFDELWQFNTLSHTWHPLPPLPTRLQHPCISFALCVWERHVVQYGGTGVPFGNNNYNTVFLYNIDTKKWSQLPLSGSSPIPAYGQSSVVDGDIMYVSGGCTGTTFNLDVHAVHMLTGNTVCLYQSDAREEPKARYRHEMLLHDNKLLLLGGGDQQECLTLATIDAFCLATEEWVKIRTRPDPARGFPPPRLCHTAQKHKHFVYLQGGDGGPAKGLLGDTWRLSLNTLQWIRLRGADITPLSFHASAVTEEGTIYLHGGKLSASAKAARSCIMWRLPCHVVSLATLAGQAVLAALPACVSEIPPKQLHMAGFPPSFIRQAQLGHPLPPSPPPTHHGEPLQSGG